MRAQTYRQTEERGFARRLALPSGLPRRYSRPTGTRADFDCPHERFGTFAAGELHGDHAVRRADAVEDQVGSTIHPREGLLLSIVTEELLAGSAAAVAAMSRLRTTGWPLMAISMALFWRNQPGFHQLDAHVVSARGPRQQRLSVKFYLVAMLFILFHIEVILLFPWAVIYRDMLKENGGLILGSMICFLVILFVGYIYALKKHAFDWKS